MVTTTLERKAAQHPEFNTHLSRYYDAGIAAGCPQEQMANFLRAGLVLQPKQLRFAAAAREADLPGGPTMIGFGGARGGGKSFVALCQMGADDCQRVPGLKCLLLRKVARAAKESLRDLLPQVFPHLAHEWNETNGVVTFENGSRILIGHYQTESEIDDYLGLEYDVIGVEEATTLSSAKIRNIRTCLRTSKPNWRPRMYLTSNPGGIGHAWFKAMFILPNREKRETDTRFISATVDDNAFVNEDYTAILDSLTGWQYKAWRLGDWDISAGSFFSNWRQDIHVVPWFMVPPQWRAWGAMDYGFSHFQVMGLFAQDDDGHIYMIGEHAARQMLTQQHVMAWRQLLARNGMAQGRLMKVVAGGDVFQSRDPDSTPLNQRYHSFGITLEPANTDRIAGASQILNLLGDVEAKVQPRLFVMDCCRGTIAQLPEMQHDPNRPEDVLKVDVNEDGQGGDDYYDDFRYGVMAAPPVVSRVQQFSQQPARRNYWKGGQIG